MNALTKHELVEYLKNHPLLLLKLSLHCNNKRMFRFMKCLKAERLFLPGRRFTVA